MDISKSCFIQIRFLLLSNIYDKHNTKLRIYVVAFDMMILILNSELITAVMTLVKMERA